MCNTFAVYFQIFATFGYKKVKNSELFQCHHVENKPIKETSLSKSRSLGCLLAGLGQAEGDIRVNYLRI